MQGIALRIGFALLLVGFACTAKAYLPATGAGLGASSAPVVVSTWDPANKGGNVVLTNSNLTATLTILGWDSFLSTSSKTAGKLYIEYQVAAVVDTNEQLYGLCYNNQDVNSFLTNTGDAVFVRGTQAASAASGTFSINAGNLPTYTTGVGDVLQVAVNLGTGKAWIGFNNTYGGNPVTAASPAITWTTGSPVLACGSLNFTTGQTILHTAATNQMFSPPTGFSTWD